MSEDMFALLVTTAIIALALVWVPALNFICPPCGRALDRFRQRTPMEEQASPVVVRDSVL